MFMNQSLSPTLIPLVLTFMTSSGHVLGQSASPPPLPSNPPVTAHHHSVSNWVGFIAVMSHNCKVPVLFCTINCAAAKIPPQFPSPSNFSSGWPNTLVYGMRFPSNHFTYFMFPKSVWMLLKTKFQAVYALWGYFLILLLVFYLQVFYMDSGCRGVWFQRT